MKRMMIVMAVAAMLTAGCATTGSNSATAQKTLDSISIVVDAAMKGYAAWVAAGHPVDPAQQAKVQEALAAYQLAATLAAQLIQANAASPNAQAALATAQTKSEALQSTITTVQPVK